MREAVKREHEVEEEREEEEQGVVSIYTAII